MGKGDRKTRKGKRFIGSRKKRTKLNGYMKSEKMKQNRMEKNIFEKYIEKLDSSEYGHSDSYKINDEFQEVIEKLVDAGLNDIAIKADLDRQVFAVRKSFDYVDNEAQGIAKGLSWQVSGVQTLQDGTKVPFYWPDVRRYTQEDFEYFEERYKEAKNLYAKTEYGLMVYFGQKTDFSKRNDFKSQLCNELQKLAEKYYDEAQKGDSQKIGYILSILTMAFKIASRCKLQTQLENAINLLFEIQQNWDIKSTNTAYVPLEYSVFMSDNYAVFKKYIDFSKVVSRNDYAIGIIEKENPYGGC